MQNAQNAAAQGNNRRPLDHVRSNAAPGGGRDMWQPLVGEFRISG